MLALAAAAKLALGLKSRPGLDAMIAKTPAPDGVESEASEVVGVAGWWCWPEGADRTAAMLHLHGGAWSLPQRVILKLCGRQTSWQ